MKRLTSKRIWEEAKSDLKHEMGYSHIWKRLSAIEDILGDDYDLDRLKELVEADREGKCVVLPCKDWFEIVFGNQEVFYGIDTDYIEHPIREISVDSSSRCTWYNGWKTVVLKGYDENKLDWEFSPEDIGKTVFLTCEEAKAAREKMKGENEEWMTTSNTNRHLN